MNQKWSDFDSDSDRPATIFFAAYSGPSMNPTLREPEIIEIKPYGDIPLREGDVVFFTSPQNSRPVVHRVVRVTPSGISTLGDNNTREDAFLLQPKDIKGQVVAAWHGRKRRVIPGGYKGRSKSLRLSWQRVLDRGVSSFFHPLYQSISHLGLIARLFPFHFRPKIAVFHIQGRDQYQLLWGQYIIGRYNDQKHQWQIKRPFRLFTDNRVLQSQPGKSQTDVSSMSGERQTLNDQPAKKLHHTLILADESCWEIAAGDKEAAFIVSQLSDVMQLDITDPLSLLTKPAFETCRTDSGKSDFHGIVHRLLVRVDSRKPDVSPENYYNKLLYDGDANAVCVLRPYTHRDGLCIQLMELSLIFARDAQTRGGVILHGALAERDGIGVILAGPGGIGKSTAGYRLPASWHSLCDDTTLVVRNTQGKYLAHPWPTWSRFLRAGSGGTWNVQKAVSLKGIFFLSQAAEDRVESIGSSHAVSLLAECAEQTSQLMLRNISEDELRTLRLERLGNLCALARVVPIHVLHNSLTGTFWQKIEQSLERSQDTGQPAAGKITP